VAGTGVATRSIVENAGLAQGAQVGNCADARLAADYEGVGDGTDAGDRHQVLLQVIHAFLQERQCQVGARDQQEGVAVRLRGDGRLHADDAIGTGAVLDDDLLAEVGGESLGERAGHHVAGPADTEGEEHPDR
jgi:hypothetical protein